LVLFFKKEQSSLLHIGYPPGMDLQTALALHQSGRLPAATAAYQAVLAREPANAEALHGFGVLRHQNGDPQAASDLFARAVLLRPANAEYRFNHGLALFRLGRFDQAQAELTEAARLKPDWALPLYNLGVVLQAAGQPDAAIRAYRAALKRQPDYPQAEANLANILKAEGKLDQAIAAYRRILRRHPTLHEVHNNLGAALKEEGDGDGAMAALREALRLKPDFPEAMANLASIAIQRAGSFAEARALYARAARLLAPRLDGPEPGLTTRLTLAECLRVTQEHERAAALLHDTIARYPESWRARMDLVETLRLAGRFRDAEAALPGPPPPASHYTDQIIRGTLWRDLGAFDRAEAAFRAAAKLRPGLANPRYSLAHVLLSAGRLEEGFAAWEWRIPLTGAAVRPGRPWNGTAPRGRHILLVAEEGLGDTIQFARWIPRLIALGARVTAIVQPPLVRLLERLDGVPSGTATIIPAGAPAPSYDAWALMMSLPHLLGLGELSALGEPYLTVEEDAIAAWRAWLPQNGLRVGLVWGGNPDNPLNHLRACPAEALAPLAAVPGVHWISLQLGAPADAIPGLTLHIPGDRITDMADTAALIAALDLVIAVDTAVAHVAGALGKPVWLLNRFNSCWRWQTGTETSVWYRTLRQFRQTEPSGWEAVTSAAAARLGEAKQGLLF
jgi:tetratricopeptide (TPR) repeat protein